MSSSDLSSVGPWARDKLERLGKYLSPYTTIMRGQSWCKGYIYVDAFAGPGRHRLRGQAHESQPDLDLFAEVADYHRDDTEQSEYINGSPRVALEIEHPFTHYIFVEMNEQRVMALEQLKDEYAGQRRIEIHREDCNGFLRRWVQSRHWKLWRAVVFLDPFGMQVPWDTIETLAETKSIEVFLNFPVGMAIQRLLKRSGEFSAAERKKLDQYFGTPDWHAAVYKRSKGLFDEVGDTLEKVRNSGEKLLDWYRGRLKHAFGYVSRARLIRNSKGSHLYYLIFAGPNKTGATIADHVLLAGELF
jgi:three-Cys-motif partner protein